MRVLFQCSATASASASASASTSYRSLLHASTIISCFPRPKMASLSLVTKTTRNRISAKSVPARDRVIDFGRHKGKMLGTLPSSYLKWVSNNLRARDFEDWANLSDDVLNDPVYRDRIEWEFAENVLNGDVSSGSPRSEGGAVSQIHEISERFGWDNDDKVGWSNIDFGLLGTSKGGRIPRVSGKGDLDRELRLERERLNDFDGEEEARGGGEKRKQRRERMRMKSGGSRLGSMEKTYGEKCGDQNEKNSGGFEDDGDDDQVMFGINQNRTVERRSPFPGRESLLKRVLISRKRLS